jgi:hypothetical protein
MMRRLIVEFSDELSALGVTVDGIDSRLAVLENDLGGWKLSGVFEFNAKIGSNGDILNVARGRNVELPSASGLDGITDFDMDKYRVFLDRRINETTSFHARLGKGGAGGHSDSNPAMVWDWYYITTKLGYDITLDAGRFNFNWEDDLGFQTDDDAFVGDVTAQQFRLSKDWGLANLQFVFGRLGDDKAGDLRGMYNAIYNASWNGIAATDPDPADFSSVGFESFLIGGLADFTFNEQFQAGVMGYYVWSEQSVVNALDSKEFDLGVYAKFKFTPSVELKGIYYYQDVEAFGADYDRSHPNNVDPWSVDDHFKAWKAILKLEQDLLKFTDLQIEYSQIDNGFHLWTDPYNSIGDVLLMNRGEADDDNTTKVFGVKAAQKWGDSRWDSWLRYYHADYDDRDVDDVQNFGVGIGYQLNPAVHFELALDYIDFGDVDRPAAGTDRHNNGGYYDEDVVVRFQTVVNF